ncbi:MAG: hypothetical protein R3C02_01715 [Planctomycetaceae bacterium]
MPASTCDYWINLPSSTTQSRASVVKIRHLCRKHGPGMWRPAADPRSSHYALARSPP